MSQDADAADPRGLIRESFRIEEITIEECRSIFLDWAISQPVGEDSRTHVEALLQRYAGEPADHPMTLVLQDALAPAKKVGRRGGARGRRG